MSCEDEPAPPKSDDGGYDKDEEFTTEVKIFYSPSYYYSTDDFFAVEMQVFLDPADATKSSRIWFDIMNNSSDKVSTSNWLEVDGADQSVKEVEWGGAWAHGTQDVETYSLYPGAISFDPNDEVILNDVYGEYKTIEIYKFSETVTFKSVEYDEQQGQEVYDTADLGDVTDGLRALDQAFNPAGVGIEEFQKDETNLEVKLLNENDKDELISFINTNRNKNKDIYLAGIQGFHTGDNVLNSKLGVTVKDEDGNWLGCLIAHDAIINFVKYIIDLPTNHPEKKFRSYKNVHQAVVIHEVGHLLGKFGHPQDHTSYFCIMFDAISDQGLILEEEDLGPVRSTYVNPQFCSNCLAKIDNNT